MPGWNYRSVSPQRQEKKCRVSEKRMDESSLFEKEMFLGLVLYSHDGILDFHEIG